MHCAPLHYPFRYQLTNHLYIYYASLSEYQTEAVIFPLPSLILCGQVRTPILYFLSESTSL